MSIKKNMKRKLKLRWSTIPPILTKHTRFTSHLKSLNTKKGTTTFDVGNPGPVLRWAQTCLLLFPSVPIYFFNWFLRSSNKDFIYCQLISPVINLIKISFTWYFLQYILWNENGSEWVSEWVSDYCLAPTQQYFSHIMTRTSYFSMWNENGFIDMLHHFSLLYYLSFITVI
jgi:hypothetical protein